MVAVVTEFDDRGVATLIGLLLLIALVLLVFSIMQATVVPGETRSVEAAHNDQIQTEMVAFGDTIDRTARGGERVASLSLSPDYVERPFLLSPGSVGGSLSTDSGTITISNANISAPFSNEALFRAQNPTLETNRVVYEPNYREYDTGGSVLCTNTGWSAHSSQPERSTKQVGLSTARRSD